MVVFFMRGEDHRPPTTALLRTAFGLTAGEADLALALAAGERLGRIAAQRGVSIETVRTQLKSIFLKTKTRRQSDLVRVVQAQSSAALRPIR
jgi:DNA-binding CsgD family transcriptional regulator